MTLKKKKLTLLEERLILMDFLNGHPATIHGEAADKFRKYHWKGVAELRRRGHELHWKTHLNVQDNDIETFLGNNIHRKDYWTLLEVLQESRYDIDIFKNMKVVYYDV